MEGIKIKLAVPKINYIIYVYFINDLDYLFTFSTDQFNPEIDKWESGSMLTIMKVNAQYHQGNYTCAPSTLTPSSVIIHIIDEGKMPQDAAVYDSFDSSASRSLISYFILSHTVIRHLNPNNLFLLIINILLRL